MRIEDLDERWTVRTRGTLFVLAWVAAAVISALVAQFAAFYVVAPITRDLASSAPSGLVLRLWFQVGRAALPIFPAVGYGLAVGAFYRPRTGVRFGIATLAALIADLVVLPTIAPVLVSPTPHGSSVGFLVLQAIGAWVVGTAQWWAVLRPGGDSRGLWVVVAVIAAVASAMVATVLPFPPPMLARGGTNFAFGWHALALSAAMSGTAFVILFRPPRPSAAGQEGLQQVRRATDDLSAR